MIYFFSQLNFFISSSSSSPSSSFALMSPVDFWLPHFFCCIFSRCKIYHTSRPCAVLIRFFVSHTGPAAPASHHAVSGVEHRSGQTAQASDRSQETYLEVETKARHHQAKVLVSNNSILWLVLNILGFTGTFLSLFY